MSATVITGAAGGIGAATARALIGTSAALVLCDTDAGLLDALADELGDGVQTLPGDVTDADHIAAIVAATETAGGLSALVHAAGVSGAIGDAERIYEINLTATHHLVHGLYPLAGTGTAAVLIASQAGAMAAAVMTPEIAELLDDPTPTGWYDALVATAGVEFAGIPNVAYALTKHGVQRFAVRQAPKWGAVGGRIMSVSPGVVDTPMIHAELRDHSSQIGSIIDVTPVGGRMAHPSEIAAVAAFVCSPGASFVSGVDWLVDGGSTHQLASGR